MNVSMTGGPRPAHLHAWGDIWGRPHGEWGLVKDQGEEHMARLAGVLASKRCHRRGGGEGESGQQ